MWVHKNSFNLNFNCTNIVDLLASLWRKVRLSSYWFPYLCMSISELPSYTTRILNDVVVAILILHEWLRKKDSENDSIGLASVAFDGGNFRGREVERGYGSKSRGRSQLGGDKRRNYWCDKERHVIKDCRERKKDKAKESSANAATEEDSYVEGDTLTVTSGTKKLDFRVFFSHLVAEILWGWLITQTIKLWVLGQWGFAWLMDTR